MKGEGLIVDKSQSPLRWVVLVLGCILMIANYYCYDNPAALKTNIDDYTGNRSDYETLFSLLYTVYSVPNIFLPFVGGFFVDKFGVRVTLFATAMFITIGQIVFALGLSIKSWPVMFLGRVLYGFGGESMGVANSAILADWFKGKELALAFGLNLSIARLGSVMNNLVSPAIANSADVVFALWFGVILCGAGVGCVLIFSPIDKKMDEVIARNKEIQDVDTTTVALMGGLADDVKMPSDASSKKKEASFADVKKFPFAFWILVVSCLVVYGCVLPFNNIASSLLLERDFFKEAPAACALQFSDGTCQSEFNQPVNCPSGKNYQPPLPLNVTVGGTYYAEVAPSDVDCTDDVWSDGCTVEYCNRLDDAVLNANTIMSIPYIISACLSPILGGFVDRFGLRAVIATIAPMALVLVHTLMGATDVDPIGPMVGQGIAYSAFAAVIWPSIPLVIPTHFIGLGYGVTTSVQNAGLAAFPLIIASIYSDSGDTYIPNVEYFFVGLAVLGAVIGFYLNYYDYQHDSLFNSPTRADRSASKDLERNRAESFTPHERVHRALSNDGVRY